MTEFNFWKKKDNSKWWVLAGLWGVSGIPIIGGSVIGYTSFKDGAKTGGPTSIFTVMNAIHSYKAELYGPFWLRVLHTCLHNFIFDLIYAVISFLTVGFGDALSSFTDGIIFGQVIHSSLLTTGTLVFVFGEFVALWYSVYLGAVTVFILITKHRVVYPGLVIRFGIVGALLLLAAIIETHLVQGGMQL